MKTSQWTSEWTSEVPTKDGYYWMTYCHHFTKAMAEPQVVYVYGIENGKGNVELRDGSTPKLAKFVKMYSGALWSEVNQYPPLPTTDGGTK